MFNAATALGVPVAQMTQHIDSVSFCLSKVFGVNASEHCVISQGLPKNTRKWHINLKFSLSCGCIPVISLHNWGENQTKFF